MMNEPEKTAQDTPLYEQAHRKLDTMRDDLISRLKTIEGEMNRLHEEHVFVDAALQRIAPPLPQQIVNLPFPPQPAGPASATTGYERRW